MDIRCPYCNATVTVPGGGASESVNCPSCGTEVDVEGAMALAESSKVVASMAAPRKPSAGKAKATEAYSRDEAPARQGAPLDVERIGSYGLRSNDLATAKEVVFKGGDAGRGTRAPGAPAAKTAAPPPPPPLRNAPPPPPPAPPASGAPRPSVLSAWGNLSSSPKGAVPEPQRAAPPSGRPAGDLPTNVQSDPLSRGQAGHPVALTDEDILGQALDEQFGDFDLGAALADMPSFADGSSLPPLRAASGESPPAAVPAGAAGASGAAGALDDLPMEAEFEALFSGPGSVVDSPWTGDAKSGPSGGWGSSRGGPDARGQAGANVPPPETSKPSAAVNPDDPLAGLDFSLGDLLGGDDGQGPLEPIPSDGHPRAPVQSVGSLDLDAVLREDSVPDAQVPWGSGGGGAEGGLGAKSTGAPTAFDIGRIDLDLGGSDVWSKTPEPGSEPVSSSSPAGKEPRFGETSVIPGAGEFQGLGDLGGEFLDTPAGDGGAFPMSGGLELDVAPGGASKGPATLPPPAAGAAPAVAIRQVRRGASTARVAMIGLLIVVLVGAILGQTPYGYFGANLLFDDGQHPAARRVAGLPGKMAGISHDTKEAFQQEAARLDRVLRDDPKNEGAKAELLEVLLRFRERYPKLFGGDPKLVERLKVLASQTSIKGQKADMVRVMDLVNAGKFGEARALLDGMVVASAQDPDVLYFYGKVALGQGKPEEAERYFELALLKNPGNVAAKYFLALTYVAKKDLAKATATLDEILAKEPGHLASKVTIAELALEGHDLDKATKFATEVVATAAPVLDAGELFGAHLVLARVNEDRNAVPERLAELTAALAIQPDHEETAVAVSKLLTNDGKKDQALGVLEPCRAKPCTGELFLATYAEAAFASAKDDIAEGALKEGTEKYPKSPAFALIRGRHLLEAKMTRAAIAALGEALKIDPGLVEGRILMSSAMTRDGKLSEAVSVLKEGLEADHQSVALLIALAGVQKEQRDWTGAEDSLRRAVGLDPMNIGAQRDLGLIVHAEGRSDEAVRILGALDAKHSLDKIGAMGLASAYLEMREIGRAKDLLARLYAHDETDPDLAAEYGRTLMEAGSMKNGTDVLQKVIKEHPSHALSHFYLGRLLMRVNSFEASIEELHHAVSLESGNQKYRLELARALLAGATPENLRDARNQLDQVIAAYSHNDVPESERDADAFVLRGKLLFDEQKYGLAIKDFESALVLSPSRLDTLVGSGRALYEMAHYDEASPYFRQVLSRDPDSADANYFLGRILLHDKKIDLAKQHLERAIHRDPKKFPDAYRQLGLIYKDQGLNGLARKTLQMYLDRVPRGSAEAEEIHRMVDRLK